MKDVYNKYVCHNIIFICMHFGVENGGQKSCNKVFSLFYWRFITNEKHSNMQKKVEQLNENVNQAKMSMEKNLEKHLIKQPRNFVTTLQFERH